MSTNPQEFADVPFKLNKDLHDRVTHTICRRVQLAVDGCSVRDNILMQYGLQFDGLSQGVSDGPWNGSCQIEHPLSQELALRVTSYLMASTKADPQALLEAVKPDEQDLIQDIEMAFNAKLKQWDIQSMFYDNALNACIYPFAVCAVRWSQNVVQVREMVPSDPETGEALSPERAEYVKSVSGAEDLPKIAAVKDEVVSDGPIITTVYPRDFYLYPAEAQSVAGGARGSGRGGPACP